jgi:prevent-host-death family protein
MSANDAKARFGQLLDAARRDPVTIEKHGRPVAVVISKEEYDEIEMMKLERLRAEAQIGIDQLERGEFMEVDENGLRDLADKVKEEGRKRAADK